MLKITIDIDGIACERCEARVNDAVKKAFSVKKVTSSCKKKQTEIIAEGPIDDGALKAAIEESGYKVARIHTEPHIKKGFSLFRR